MTKFLRGTFLAALALAPASAFAATQIGNLNVTTTISVSCDAPSPSGTLRLPFDSDIALNAQALAETPVTVTCYGNPTVNHVDFDGGTHRDRAAITDENDVRYMLRSGASTTEESDFLGYKLYAAQGTESSSSAISAEMGTDSSSQNNRLEFTSFDGSFSVTGKVFESAARDFGDPTSAASGGAVPGGTYSDVVVMTVDYN